MDITGPEGYTIESPMPLAKARIVGVIDADGIEFGQVSGPDELGYYSYRRHIIAPGVTSISVRDWPTAQLALDCLISVNAESACHCADCESARETRS
jgi:hypothetical protein